MGIISQSISLLMARNADITLGFGDQIRYFAVVGSHFERTLVDMSRVAVSAGGGAHRNHLYTKYMKAKNGISSTTKSNTSDKFCPISISIIIT